MIKDFEMMPEEEIRKTVLAVQNGDTEQFEKLYLKSQGMVYGIITHTIDPDDIEFSAEDIMQDIFITALTHIDQIKNPVTFFGWLRTLARRKCIDHIRKKNRIAEPMSSITVKDKDTSEERAVEFADPNIKGNPEAFSDYNESINFMREVIDSLTIDEKRVVMDTYLYQKNDTEIMNAYGITRLKVKKLREKALETVRDKYISLEKKGADLRTIPAASVLTWMITSTVYAAEVPETISASVRNKVMAAALTGAKTVSAATVASGVKDAAAAASKETLKETASAVSKGAVKGTVSGGGKAASAAISKGLITKAATLIAVAGIGTGAAVAVTHNRPAESNPTEISTEYTAGEEQNHTEESQETAEIKLSAEEKKVLKSLYAASEKKDYNEISDIVNDNFMLLYDLETTTLDNQLMLFDGSGFLEDGTGTGLVLKTASWDGSFRTAPNTVQYSLNAFWGTFEELNVNGELFSYQADIRSDQDKTKMCIDFSNAVYKDNQPDGVISTSEYQMSPQFEKTFDFTSGYDENTDFEYTAPMKFHVKADMVDIARGDSEGFVTFSNLSPSLSSYESGEVSEVEDDDGYGSTYFDYIESYLYHVVYDKKSGSHRENPASSTAGVDLRGLWTEEQQTNFMCILNGFQYVYDTQHGHSLSDLNNLITGKKTYNKKKVADAMWFAVYFGLFHDMSQFENPSIVFQKNDFDQALQMTLGYDCSNCLEEFLSDDGEHYEFEVSADLGDEGPFVGIQESIPTDYGYEIHAVGGYHTGEEIDTSYDLNYYLYYNGNTIKYPFRLRYVEC